MFNTSSKIDKKRKLEKQLALKKAGIHGLSETAEHARQHLFESNRRLSEHKNSFAFLHGQDGSQHVFEQLAEKARDAENRHREAVNAVNQCHEEIRALDAALLESGVAATYEDLVAYQEKTAAAKQAVENIQALISGNIAVRDSSPPAPDFTREREDLLAEIALGNAHPSDLEALDKRIADAMAEAKKTAQRLKPGIDDAKHSINGLGRKLEEAQAEYEELKGKRKDFILAYLESEAEKSGVEYIRLASDLMERYKRLLAIDSMRVYLDANSHKSGSMQDIHIPTFSSHAFSGKGLKNQFATLYSGKQFTYSGWAEIENIMDSEWDKIKSVGEHLA